MAPTRSVFVMPSDAIFSNVCNRSIDRLKRGHNKQIDMPELLKTTRYIHTVKKQTMNNKQNVTVTKVQRSTVFSLYANVL